MPNGQFYVSNVIDKNRDYLFFVLVLIANVDFLTYLSYLCIGEKFCQQKE